jgi:hypothetical protein
MKNYNKRGFKKHPLLGVWKQNISHQRDKKRHFLAAAQTGIRPFSLI